MLSQADETDLTLLIAFGHHMKFMTALLGFASTLGIIPLHLRHDVN
jgi:hypothetical protein